MPALYPIATRSRRAQQGGCVSLSTKVQQQNACLHRSDFRSRLDLKKCDQWLRPRSSRGKELKISRRKRAGDTETKIEAPADGGAFPFPIRQGEVLRNTVPGTAADDAAVAIAPGPGRAICWCAVVTLVVAILGPLPHIANHVVKAKAVGGERPDRRRLLVIPLAATASEFGERQAGAAIGVVLPDGAAPRMGHRHRPEGRR